MDSMNVVRVELVAAGCRWRGEVFTAMFLSLNLSICPLMMAEVWSRAVLAVVATIMALLSNGAAAAAGGGGAATELQLKLELEQALHASLDAFAANRSMGTWVAVWFSTEDKQLCSADVGSHACSIEATIRLIHNMPLGCPFTYLCRQ
jgi:hypothetical protein